MILGCKRLVYTASLAALVHIVGMPAARAGIVLTISDDFGHNETVNGSDTSAFTLGEISVGAFRVFASARSNFGISVDNTGFLTSFNSTVKNVELTPGNLYITVSETGFTLPSATLPNFEYLNSSVVSNQGTDKGTARFTSYLHQSGTLSDTTTGAQNVTTIANARSVMFQRTATTYDLRNTTIVTLAGGQLRDVSGNTSVTLIPPNGYGVLQAVPEPSSIVALLSSLPLVGAGIYLRRRKHAA